MRLQVGEGQSPAGWMETVREALAWWPEEIDLYPLHVRPLTGLGRLRRSWDDQRLAAYRAGRDLLLAAGYEQVSMRMFRRARGTDGSEAVDGRAGRTVVSVDGDGTVRCCHFIPDVIGNLYEEGFASNLTGRPCTNATCGCHIGYVHLDELDLYSIFGDGVLERIPGRPSLTPCPFVARCWC